MIVEIHTNYNKTTTDHTSSQSTSIDEKFIQKYVSQNGKLNLASAKVCGKYVASSKHITTSMEKKLLGDFNINRKQNTVLTKLCKRPDYINQRKQKWRFRKKTKCMYVSGKTKD